ncbi:MAG: excalibur calcium-binding domain-containing protein [Hyphomonas sp.]|uniref:excalibur calcium-binding domain-containing protein n=1 Tax=Hyphomonas sp. TaxID=87 RepID=UPI0018588F48|nr:excalibur calcium-binding domain-containing protein [Hyphomonas sp.]MBU3919198.1 excalibur calcium-binding domain-containing protein [Alphaproteobacteria bacterium]MBU4062110.1 excalibur calcium-binding domain-containing protein [Alphaproteobacteria bacterium]MBU4165545.1 excalibur calcium-binding domain-containing protein [Alphaproteobacteria bacterium]
MKPKHLVIFACTAVLAAPAFAHGGGLNAEGCHMNRKTGDYHCHRSPSSPPPPPRTDGTARPQALYDRPAGEISTPFANCTAARAAGAAPVRIGDPGYGSHLDRDGDGVGCE